MLLILKLLYKIEREGTLPNLFLEDIVILISTPQKDATKKENYRPIEQNSIMLNKIFAN